MVLVLCSVSSWKASWGYGDRWTLMSLASSMIPLLGLNAIRNGALRGMREVFFAQLPELLGRPGIHLVVVCGLLLFNALNPVTAIFSQITSVAVALLIGVYLLRRVSPASLREAGPVYKVGEWRKALVPFTLLSTVSMLNAEIGILLLGMMGNSEGVAAMRIAQSGAQIVSFSLIIVNMVIAPHITRAHQENNQRQLQLLSRQSARMALMAALPFALPMIFFGRPIIDFVYGAAYVESVVIPLSILAVGQVINVAFGSVGLFLTMTGHEGDTLKGQIFAIIANIAAALVLIPLLGAVGAAAAAVLGLLIWNIVLAFKFAQRLKLRPTIL